MALRWRILILLFAVRAAMGFQFQAIGALSPLVMDAYAVRLADIGLIIGLYLAPGIGLALPGGALGARLGDTRVVVIGLMLMLAGAALALVAPSWEAQIVARLLAGVGGVLLNVIMSKMVTDWFAGREIATSMGIFVNSWPFGIALALVVLPWVAEGGGGLSGAFAMVTALTAAGLVAMVVLYPSPQSAGPAAAALSEAMGARVLTATLIAGAIWGLYNAALGMIFSFGPAMLAGQGWEVTAASGATSIVLWLVALSVPAGGIIADRTGRRDLVLVLSSLAMAAVLILATRADNTSIWGVLVLLGLVAGLPAGPIMSLPAKVLSPGTRAVGMGLFYTIFYTCVVVGPFAAGWLADHNGRAAVTFELGAVLLVITCLLLAVFNVVSRKPTA